MSDEHLLARVQQGDTAALETLLRRHAPAVVRFARRLCDDPVDADDVVQETLIAAARRFGELRSAQAIPTWLYAVARSFCAKRRRRGRHAPTAVVPLGEEADAAPAPDEHLSARETSLALDQAIRALAPMYREVLVLRDVEGMTAPEVGDVLGIGVDAVKSRLHRARAAVRARVEPVLAARGPACPDIARTFSRYLEGDIGPEACAAMEAHVEGCPSCHAACAALKRTVALCRAHGEEVPPDVGDRVRAALRVVLAR